MTGLSLATIPTSLTGTVVLQGTDAARPGVMTLPSELQPVIQRETLSDGQKAWTRHCVPAANAKPVAVATLDTLRAEDRARAELGSTHESTRQIHGSVLTREVSSSGRTFLNGDEFQQLFARERSDVASQRNTDFALRRYRGSERISDEETAHYFSLDTGNISIPRDLIKIGDENSDSRGYPLPGTPDYPRFLEYVKNMHLAIGDPGNPGLMRRMGIRAVVDNDGKLLKLEFVNMPQEILLQNLISGSPSADKVPNDVARTVGSRLRSGYRNIFNNREGTASTERAMYYASLTPMGPVFGFKGGSPS